MPRSRLLCLLLFLLAAAPARPEVTALEIHRREPFAGGGVFGTRPYEKITGVVRFAIDPGHPRNRLIVDLGLAPRNTQGKVEFEADFFILAPKDPVAGNGAILYDVNNRGNKLALGMFNRAPGGNDPTTLADAGDGFLMRRGYTVVWCGWIGELLPGQNRLLLRAPVATEEGKPIRGLVRYEMVSDAPRSSMPLSRRDGHGSYPLTERGEKEGVLTMRPGPRNEPRVIPRDRWSLERRPIPAVDRGVAGTLPPIHLKVEGGFQPGMIYELLAEAEGPIVQGCGFAAVRDLVSFLKYDSSAANPFRRPDGKPALTRAHGFGVSQSGRFLRNFLYLGFNIDEANRKVFDGVMPHVAGGGLGFFNHRFAQPTRHNAQHEEHWYPADYFPFTYGLEQDPYSGRVDSILKRLEEEGKEFLPKIMHTQSSAEYWHRSGSLVHTDPLGTRDSAIPENVRIYVFGGTQHGPASDPPGKGIGQNLLNPADYRPQLRALLVALDNWVSESQLPIASVYPRIDKGTLVPYRQTTSGFPSIPGVRYPGVIQCPPWSQMTLDAMAKGTIPVDTGHNYVVLVPACDADGNDQGVWPPPEVAIPLGTYTGWNLRRADVGAEDQLVSLAGSFIPFLRTAAQRQASGDSRLSLEERYGDYGGYLKKFSEYCSRSSSFPGSPPALLREDAERLIKGREKYRDWFSKNE